MQNLQMLGSLGENKTYIFSLSFPAQKPSRATVLFWLLVTSALDQS